MRYQRGKRPSLTHSVPWMETLMTKILRVEEIMVELLPDMNKILEASLNEDLLVDMLKLTF